MCCLILNGGCSKRVVLFSIIHKEMQLVPLIYLNFITSLVFAKSQAIKNMSLPGSSILAFSGLGHFCFTDSVWCKILNILLSLNPPHVAQ